MHDRKHLVSTEIEKLMEAAKGSRNAARDRCLQLLMFRHGLRVLEACGLRLSQVDTDSRVLHVARLKHGLSTTHPLRGDELRAIKAWLVERAKMQPEDGVGDDPRLWQEDRIIGGSAPAYPPPCLRLCPRRPGR
jgi:type 1 fimbriae regulatory protein FimB